MWVFPMGAFYLAYLETHGNTKEAANQGRFWLSAVSYQLFPKSFHHFARSQLGDAGGLQKCSVSDWKS